MQTLAKLQEMRDPRELGWRYCFAIVLILAAVTASHLAGTVLSRPGADLATAINVSGKQRMLSQRITLFATEVARNAHPKDQQDPLLLMVSALREFEASHNDLVTRSTLSPDHLENYFGTAMGTPLDAMVKEFVLKAKRLPYLGIADQIKVVEQMQSVAAGELLTRLDMAVQQFEQAALIRDQRAQRFANFSYLLALGVLALVVLMIFLPAHRMVKAAMNGLEERNKSLKKSREETQRALDAKSSFLSKISHELRTPLNGIFASTDLLKDENLSADGKEILEILSDSSIEMEKSVEKLIAGSQPIDAGEASCLNAKLWAVQQLDKFQKRARKEQMNVDGFLDASLDESEVLHWEGIERILEPLIDNAVKFGDGAPLEFTCMIARDIVPATEPAQLIISVKDNGIGIPRDALSRVFEPFAQVDEGRNRAFDGLGIGLSNARDLARAMNGEILVSSVAGEGSEFTITIPLIKTEAAAA